MHSALLNQLQLCTATSSVQNIFATPTLSFKIFCPSLSSRLETNESNQKRPSGDRHTDRGGDRNTDRGQNNDKKQRLESRGSIINKTGKKIYFPRGLDKKYCSDFMDAGENCRHGDKCHFVHAVFPGGFTEHDRPLVAEYIKNEPGLSMNPNCKTNQNVSTSGFGR